MYRETIWIQSIAKQKFGDCIHRAHLRGPVLRGCEGDNRSRTSSVIPFDGLGTSESTLALAMQVRWVHVAFPQCNWTPDTCGTPEPGSPGAGSRASRGTVGVTQSRRFDILRRARSHFPTRHYVPCNRIALAYR